MVIIITWYLVPERGKASGFSLCCRKFLVESTLHIYHDVTRVVNTEQHVVINEQP